MSDCPYNCDDGYIINPYTHRKEVCPHCLAVRRKEVRQGDHMDKLKLPPSLTGGNFVPDAVILKDELKILEPESVIEVIDRMKSLISDAALGVAPDESILFNLGRRAVDANFIAPFMTKAYMGGLSITPLLTGLDILQSRHALDYREEDKLGDIPKFPELLDKQVCVISIDAGTTREEILAVKGLLQLRGRKNLPTIIITHVWNPMVLSMCSEVELKGFDIATLYQVVYTKNQERYSRFNKSQRVSAEEYKEMQNHGV